ncbi:MAG: hypothetical protein LCI03_19595, partial [Actinobacteria bacterium]|nr:hypothetical protein [Actinomycetota bacterium]
AMKTSPTTSQRRLSAIVVTAFSPNLLCLVDEITLSYSKGQGFSSVALASGAAQSRAICATLDFRVAFSSSK